MKLAEVSLHNPLGIYQMWNILENDCILNDLTLV